MYFVFMYTFGMAEGLVIMKFGNSVVCEMTEHKHL
jgi:hypothetical protein